MDELICVARAIYDDVKGNTLLDPLTKPNTAETRVYRPFNNLTKDSYAGALVYFSSCVSKQQLGELRLELNRKVLTDVSKINDDEFLLLAGWAIAGFKQWCATVNCNASLFYVPDSLKELAEKKINLPFIESMRCRETVAEDYIRKFVAHCYLLYLRDETVISLNIQENFDPRVSVKAEAAGKINSTLMNFTIKPREIVCSNLEGCTVHFFVGSNAVKLDAKIPNLANLLVNHL